MVRQRHRSSYSNGRARALRRDTTMVLESREGDEEEDETQTRVSKRDFIRSQRFIKTVIDPLLKDLYKCFKVKTLVI